MAVNKYTSAKFSLRAVIDGTEINEIAEFSSVTELNNIPMARLLVAVGRNVRTLKPATIHTLTEKLKVHVPAKVYLKVTQLSASAGAGRKWPSKEFVIFDGYATGTGYIRSRDTQYFSIALLHWLSDLNNASAVSATSHPYNPSDFTYGAAAPVAESAGAGAPGWVPMSVAQGAIDAGKLSQDFWLEVLHPWMLDIAKQDSLNTLAAGTGVSSGGNKDAIAALNRMTGANSKGKYVPLAMNLGTGNSTAIEAGISGALRAETVQSWFNTTLWGKLVGDWAPSYFFAVVPRIEDALVVPATYSLKTSYLTIKADDYSNCQLNSTLPQVLRAVGIFCGAMAESGGSDSGSPIDIAYNSLAGRFPGDWDKANAKGVIMLKSAPRWLADSSAAQQYSRSSSGAGSTDPVGTALTPGEGEEPPADAGTPAENYKAFYANDGLLDRYAHQWFVLEMLKGRSGELSGMLRFDIAPGTSVKIESSGDRALGSKDKLGKPFFANVARVTHMINGETNLAGTAFALDHIRTEADNNDPEEKMSIAKPPLYQTAWLGAGLNNDF